MLAPGNKQFKTTIIGWLFKIRIVNVHDMWGRDVVLMSLHVHSHVLSRLKHMLPESPIRFILCIICDYNMRLYEPHEYLNTRIVLQGTSSNSFTA
jgi:elongation factor P hydroxylase